MKIKCEHFNGTNTTFVCETCKYYNKCSLIQPTNQQHQELQKEINWWLKELRMAKDRLKEYEAIVKDITDHKYAIPVNVYGSIKYAPRKNALGVFIRRPEHVMYGWNLNKLEHRKEEILEKIRELTHMELEVRRTLS